MFLKVSSLLLVIVLTDAGVSGAVLAKLEDFGSHPEYSFSYSVNDPSTGDNKEQHETRDGDVVSGQYSFIEADGSRRTVDYSADSINGFNAVVSKSVDSPVTKVVEHEPVEIPTKFATVPVPTKLVAAPVPAKLVAAPVIQKAYRVPVQTVVSQPLLAPAPFAKYHAPVYHAPLTASYPTSLAYHAPVYHSPAAYSLPVAAAYHHAPVAHYVH